ncbi:C40 family peptidase [Planobispora takensis]|uniref:NlpC/P60 domain-containing protein n=1 Tax=Planobispora takensis TaxID=1367882 RepID=A0A8J3SV47_9ACTN|nr:C40 family peptidase [Planobispora takensis]GII01082.1 hypothetical protein Pta02_30900 [Planobispora takensis]
MIVALIAATALAATATATTAATATVALTGPDAADRTSRPCSRVLAHLSDHIRIPGHAQALIAKVCEAVPSQIAGLLPPQRPIRVHQPAAILTPGPEPHPVPKPRPEPTAGHEPVTGPEPRPGSTARPTPGPQPQPATAPDDRPAPDPRKPGSPGKPRTSQKPGSSKDPGASRRPKGRSTRSGRPDRRPTPGQIAAAAALRRIGTPYVWGGGSSSGPTRGGFDCSGLALHAWSKAGAKLTHYTGSQFTQGRRVPFSQLRPGDLVFFGGGTGDPTHVGIYVKNGVMVHAPKSGDVVKTTDFAASPYYRALYRGAVRPTPR